MRRASTDYVLAQEGTAKAEKRAVVGAARKLAILPLRSGNLVNLMNPSARWPEPFWLGYALAAAAFWVTLDPTEDGRFGTIALQHTEVQHDDFENEIAPFHPIGLASD